MNFFDDEDKKYEYIFCHYVMSGMYIEFKCGENIFVNSPYFTYNIIVNNINNPTIFMLYDMLMINRTYSSNFSFKNMYLDKDLAYSNNVTIKYIELLSKLNDSTKYTNRRYIIHFILWLLKILEELIYNIFYEWFEPYNGYDIFVIYLKYINKIFNFDYRDIFILFSKGHTKFNHVNDFEKYIDKIKDKFVVDKIKDIFMYPIESNTKNARKVNN